MKKQLSVAALLGCLLATPAIADPGIKVEYRNEMLRVTLEGSYAGTYYRVWRSDELLGENAPLNSQFALCTGDCYLTDQEVTPGKTYQYRFELQGSGGRLLTYGPYPITIPDTPVANCPARVAFTCDRKFAVSDPNSPADTLAYALNSRRS